MRLDGVALQGGGDLGHQLCLVELVHRQVHRHAHAQAAVAPGAGLAAGFIDDPVAQGIDQPVALGHRHEDQRADHAALRVVPAHQGFHTGDLPAGRVNLGLVDELQLVARQGQA